MFGWDAILAFGLKNWKPIAVVVAIASLIGYITFLHLEVEHYKEKYTKEHSEFLVYKKASEAKQAALVEGGKNLTSLYAQTSADYYSLLEKHKQSNIQAIKDDKELNSLRVSNRALQLLNSTTYQPGIKVPASTIQTNDGKTSGTEGSTTLSVVFAVMAENNANHLKCVKQVEEWQTFWKDYTTLVEGVEANATSP